MAAETLKEQLQKQQAQLTNDRSSFDPHWRELSDFINPRGSRFLVTDVNRDDRRNTKIVDPPPPGSTHTIERHDVGDHFSCAPVVQAGNA